jgi:hypothetical protein
MVGDRARENWPVIADALKGSLCYETANQWITTEAGPRTGVFNCARGNFPRGAAEDMNEEIKVEQWAGVI